MTTTTTTTTTTAPVDLCVGRERACTYVSATVYDAMRSPNVGERARAMGVYAGARATAALCTPAVPVYAGLLPFVAGADAPDGGAARVRSSFDALAETYVLFDTLRPLARTADSRSETASIASNYAEVCARRVSQFARDVEALVPAHVGVLRGPGVGANGGALLERGALSLAESAALRELARCYTLDVLHALEYTVATLLDVPRERRRDLLSPRDDPLKAQDSALVAEAVALFATCAEQSVRGAKHRLGMYAQVRAAAAAAVDSDPDPDPASIDASADGALERYADEADPLLMMLAYMFYKGGATAGK